MMIIESKSSTPTVRDLLDARHDIADVSDSPLMDCQLILAHVLGVSRSWLYAHGDEELDTRIRRSFAALLEERRQGVPVAYLTGQRWFWNMELEVTEETLVPRPETECLVAATLERLDAGSKTIVDAGTGTGAIAVALAAERPAWQILAGDISAGALAVARRNVARWAPGAVTLLQGDWLSAIGANSLDAVVCNPPYIPAGDPHLLSLQREPYNALASGDDGLVAIRQVVTETMRCLRRGGLLIMEHGFDQVHTTRSLALESGFASIETLRDLNGLPRVLVARKPQ